MSDWREKIWLKIVALTIVGVFLFSEVTWAARADFSLSLPQIPFNSSSYPSEGSLKDVLWQIYQGVSSFLIPPLHAEEPAPYNTNDFIIPGYNPNLTWKTPNNMVISDKETGSDEENTAAWIPATNSGSSFAGWDYDEYNPSSRTWAHYSGMPTEPPNNDSQRVEAKADFDMDGDVDDDDLALLGTAWGTKDKKYDLNGDSRGVSGGDLYVLGNVYGTTGIRHIQNKTPVTVNDVTPPTIESQLKNPDATVRKQAIRALGEAGTAQAVDTLIAHIMNESDGDNRTLIIQIIGRIGNAQDKQIAQNINDLLYNEDQTIRKTAAEALGQIGDPRAVDPLIEALHDADWSVRVYAAEALGQIGDSRAVKPLIEALGDADWVVRVYAAEALGQIGDPRAVDPLIEALGDENSSVRAAAAEALGLIGDPRAVDPLIEALLGDENSTVRAAAAEALGKIGDLGAVEPLSTALFNDEEWNVRRCALGALKAIAAKVGDSLENILASTVIQYTGLTIDYIKNGSPDGLSYNDLASDLPILAQLYQKYGDQAARYILEEYNISLFGRYTLDTLSHLYDYRPIADGGKGRRRLTDDSNSPLRPLAVVAFPKTDSNGAFYSDGGQIQTLLDAGYDVRIVESGDEETFADNIKRMHDDYGEIDLLVIGGHGTPQTVAFKVASTGDESVPTGNRAGKIDLGDDKLFTDYIAPYLSPNADIVLSSCSTGKGDNSIAQFISGTLNARVFAPDGATNIDSFTFGYKDDRTPFLMGVKYDGVNTMIYDNRIPTLAVAVLKYGISVLFRSR